MKGKHDVEVFIPAFKDRWVLFHVVKPAKHVVVSVTLVTAGVTNNPHNSFIWNVFSDPHKYLFRSPARFTAALAEALRIKYLPEAEKWARELADGEMARVEDEKHAILEDRIAEDRENRLKSRMDPREFEDPVSENADGYY